jgi:hypothetical protein
MRPLRDSVYSYLKKYDPGCFSQIPDPDADFLTSRILDPNYLHPGSGILNIDLKYFTPSKEKSVHYSCLKKYDPGCSSQIPDPRSGRGFSHFPDPGSELSTSRIPD